jgi:hypothetical protein
MSFVAPESAQQAQSSACCTEDEFIQKQTQINGADNSRRYIRGVFAGGTFCYESQLICQRNGITAHSNTPIKGNLALNNIWQSERGIP